MRYLRWLLLLIPVAILVELAHWDEVLLFVTSALAVIPLAGLMGEATEALAEKTGPRIGGLLNATLGNAAELIITITAIREGLLDLVKDSWLVCRDCGRKYPIVDDIPVMLIDEGDKWTQVAAADLPVPPPNL